jgi:hypothetical protein
VTIREMHARARLTLLFAVVLVVAGLVLLATTEVRPVLGIGLVIGAMFASMVGGHLHGAADERARVRRS